ncbi:hypothetical protein [Lacticaseibacillus paracasei]|uniref:hypothetical protein n=1 Tax=Lacticaseibacillus paracasei TaxID=1597 RepID=UPI0009137A50|nr:hypothetical protein [Lacticaseibacillus paracasei]NMN61515.1 hypothetical protein [Lacticaseibacillus casei]NMN66436.1 hypothetical protein [Lacticaseibacillus casei CRF28]MDY0838934.1 hypothetical protein [Lacticaseibacillus paracasei]MEA0974143.1 hypothetical protein [Lacticaseibacillus paracasei]MEA1054694.1 hypothetical protein [Lacticaseibacillus paracasei]
MSNKSRATITVGVAYNRPKLASGLSLRKLSDNNTFISETMMMIVVVMMIVVALECTQRFNIAFVRKK